MTGVTAPPTTCPDCDQELLGWEARAHIRACKAIALGLLVGRIEPEEAPEVAKKPLGWKWDKK